MCHDKPFNNMTTYLEFEARLYGMRTSRGRAFGGRKGWRPKIPVEVVMFGRPLRVRPLACRAGLLFKSCCGDERIRR